MQVKNYFSQFFLKKDKNLTEKHKNFAKNFSPKKLFSLRSKSFLDIVSLLFLYLMRRTVL